MEEPFPSPNEPFPSPNEPFPSPDDVFVIPPPLMFADSDPPSTIPEHPPPNQATTTAPPVSPAKSDQGPTEDYWDDYERATYEEQRDLSDPAIIPPWDESVTVPVVVRPEANTSTGEFWLFHSSRGMQYNMIVLRSHYPDTCRKEEETKL